MDYAQINQDSVKRDFKFVATSLNVKNENNTRNNFHQEYDYKKINEKLFNLSKNMFDQTVDSKFDKDIKNGKIQFDKA